MTETTTVNTNQQETTTQPEGNGSTGKVFTQEEVNNIVRERLNRAKAAAAEQDSRATDLDKREAALKAREAETQQRENRIACTEICKAKGYGVMCQNAGTKPAAVELTAANIYDEICKASALMDEKLVPEDGRVLVVTPETYRLLKKSSEIVLDTAVGEDMRLKGVISNLDGAAIQKIPASRLPSKFGFMLCHPIATVAPLKLEDYRIHADPPGISGSLVEGRVAYDAFVLKNKAAAIYYQATV